MALLNFFRSLFSNKLVAQPLDCAIVGLGNCGDTYTNTRHNIGFRVVDALVKNMLVKKQSIEGNADFLIGRCNETKTVAVIKPRTLMNRSGFAVEYLTSYYKISPARMIVVVDDFNLPIGKIRVRKNGSDGGHNGLKSIIEKIGPDFPRLRIGIGPLAKDKSIIDFVLGDFSGAEEAALKEVVPRAVEALELFITQDMSTVMNKCNA